MSPTVNLNTLRRYKLIQELYLKHKTEDISTCQVLRKYIYPVYPISRVTLYNILSTQVDKQLKELESSRQLKMAV
ncbi:hypothetical protein Q765_00305 [Flavobacterium rivuli WB 3.3-2 = DSM 21788]|uniref:Uncharacterized protein n=1 Tax=Flavobacterium rivuli WB 3.3-2 = DSM 21788 TaxID=1121895 RepID=A0A0A2MA99_9FLAO|nr:hypothetical protein [Flavobacterium rivuli]KGO88393.1 hypothetical protein Q765_00305 [Flavobacterium rivuli WB 3.3-2 = DSM 21788]